MPRPEEPGQRDGGGGEPEDDPDGQDPRRRSQGDHDESGDADGQPDVPPSQGPDSHPPVSVVLQLWRLVHARDCSTLPRLGSFILGTPKPHQPCGYAEMPGPRLAGCGQSSLLSADGCTTHRKLGNSISRDGRSPSRRESPRHHRQCRPDEESIKAHQVAHIVAEVGMRKAPQVGHPRNAKQASASAASLPTVEEIPTSMMTKTSSGAKVK